MADERLERDQAELRDEEISLEDFLGWAEFCAWAALMMTPIIWWLQGESVSTDQFVVRCSLVVISAVAGVGLRVWAIARKRYRAAGGGVSREGGKRGSGE